MSILDQTLLSMLELTFWVGSGLCIVGGLSSVALLFRGIYRDGDVNDVVLAFVAIGCIVALVFVRPSFQWAFGIFYLALAGLSGLVLVVQAWRGHARKPLVAVFFGSGISGSALMYFIPILQQ